MLNITMDINGNVTARLHVQNLRTNTNGVAEYKVEAFIDNEPKIVAFFKHQRGDELLACAMRAIDAVIHQQGKTLTPITQTYRDSGRIG